MQLRDSSAAYKADTRLAIPGRLREDGATKRAAADEWCRPPGANRATSPGNQCSGILEVLLIVAYMNGCWAFHPLQLQPLSAMLAVGAFCPRTVSTLSRRHLQQETLGMAGKSGTRPLWEERLEATQQGWGLT
jgi:hypothetical protein